MHTTFLLKSFQGKYKNQTDAASLTTYVTKLNLMKGVAMYGSIPIPHTCAHHQIIGGLIKHPMGSWEHKLVQQTLSAHHCTR
jgi:hypothetical protein